MHSDRRVWTALKSTIISTHEDLLGFSIRKHHQEYKDMPGNIRDCSIGTEVGDGSSDCNYRGSPYSLPEGRLVPGHPFVSFGGLWGTPQITVWILSIGGSELHWGVTSTTIHGLALPHECRWCYESRWWGECIIPKPMHISVPFGYQIILDPVKSYNEVKELADSYLLND